MTSQEDEKASLVGMLMALADDGEEGGASVSGDLIESLGPDAEAPEASAAPAAGDGPAGGEAPDPGLLRMVEAPAQDATPAAPADGAAAAPAEEGSEGNMSSEASEGPNAGSMAAMISDLEHAESAARRENDRQKGAPSPASEPAAAPDVPEAAPAGGDALAESETLAAILAMGFPESDAQRAMARPDLRGNADLAVSWLLEQQAEADNAAAAAAILETDMAAAEQGPAPPAPEPAAAPERRAVPGTPVAPAAAAALGASEPPTLLLDEDAVALTRPAPDGRWPQDLLFGGPLAARPPALTVRRALVLELDPTRCAAWPAMASAAATALLGCGLPVLAAGDGWLAAGPSQAGEGPAALASPDAAGAALASRWSVLVRSGVAPPAASGAWKAPAAPSWEAAASSNARVLLVEALGAARGEDLKSLTQSFLKGLASPERRARDAEEAKAALLSIRAALVAICATASTAAPPAEAAVDASFASALQRSVADAMEAALSEGAAPLEQRARAREVSCARLMTSLRPFYEGRGLSGALPRPTRARPLGAFPLELSRGASIALAAGEEAGARLLEAAAKALPPGAPAAAVLEAARSELAAWAGEEQGARLARKALSVEERTRGVREHRRRLLEGLWRPGGDARAASGAGVRAVKAFVDAFPEHRREPLVAWWAASREGRAGDCFLTPQHLLWRQAEAPGALASLVGALVGAGDAAKKENVVLPWALVQSVALGEEDMAAVALGRVAPRGVGAAPPPLVVVDVGGGEHAMQWAAGTTADEAARRASLALEALHFYREAEGDEVAEPQDGVSEEELWAQLQENAARRREERRTERLSSTTI